jgi:hypothetical protein
VTAIPDEVLQQLQEQTRQLEAEQAARQAARLEILEGGRSAAWEPQPEAPPQRHQQPAPPTMQQVEASLRQAVADGASRADLTSLVAELARDSEHPVGSVRDLLLAVEQQHANVSTITAEAATIRAEADRQDLGQALTLDYLLPAPIAKALRIRCRALPTDDVAAAVTYMVSVSGLAKLGTRVVASQAADYRVPVNLYAALVARSGAKKSPVSRLLVNAPTQALRQEMASDHDRAIRQWQEDCRGKKPAERPDPPHATYLHVSDSTAEALAGQLQRQEVKGLGILLNRDELAGLFGSFNAYRAGRGADEELLLEAYDGSGFQSLRVATAGGGRFYDRCHLSIWGTIQPAILKELVEGGDASGLWARFLFVPLPEKVVPLGTDTEAEQRAAADAAETLADTARRIYELSPASYPLSAEAFASFCRYEARCQGDALRAVIPAQSALYGKAAGKVLRIAGLLHLLGKATGDGAAAISAGTIERAVALVDHLNGWAMSFHADAANGGASDLMRKVHRIAMEAGAPIQWRDVARRLSKAQQKEIDSAAVLAAMEALKELEVGELDQTSRKQPTYRALRPLP